MVGRSSGGSIERREKGALGSVTAGLSTAVHADHRLFVMTGEWQLADAARLDRELADAVKAASRPGDRQRPVRLVLDQLESLDTAGAWLIVRTFEQLERAGLSPTIGGAQSQHAALLDRLRSEHPEPARDEETAPAWLRLIGHLGETTIHVMQQAGQMLSFIGAAAIALAQVIVRPQRLRLGAISHHLEQTGVNALPIVALMSFLIGIVLAYQGSSQLIRFGAEVFTIDLLGVSVMRELGVLMTAIIVAGRSGSAFTAQIGTMKINQETDAMRVIGLDPMSVLVLPRFLALVIALPILSVVSVLMAYVGGALVIILGLEIPTIQFLRQLQSAVTIQTFYAGIVKAPVFAFIIAMTGCYKGMQVSGSADSVGRLTTEAVVVSIFLVIVVDAAFSVAFASLGI